MGNSSSSSYSVSASQNKNTKKEKSSSKKEEDKVNKKDKTSANKKSKNNSLSKKDFDRQFDKYAVDGKIYAAGLQDLLDYYHKEENGLPSFSVHSCSDLIESVNDSNANDTLESAETWALCQKLDTLKKAFCKAEENADGLFRITNLQGLKGVTDLFKDVTAMKIEYDSTESRLQFSDFVLHMVKLQKESEKHTDTPDDGDKEKTITIDQSTNVTLHY